MLLSGINVEIDVDIHLEVEHFNEKTNELFRNIL